MRTSIITGDDQKPDLLVIDAMNNMYVLELAVNFELNIEKNAKRKNNKYKELLKSLEEELVTYINLSMGSLGIIGKDSVNLQKLLKTTDMDKNSIAYCIKKLSACCIWCTCYLFLMQSMRPGLTPICFCGNVF